MKTQLQICFHLYRIYRLYRGVRHAMKMVENVLEKRLRKVVMIKKRDFKVLFLHKAQH